MDYKNEQFRLGRLFGMMGTLVRESYGDISFDEWIYRINESIDRLELKIKSEMLSDFMEIYDTSVNVIEIDGIKYCFVGEYELVDDELENGFGIVYIDEGEFKFYIGSDFMKDVIKGDNERLDMLKDMLG
jgi:hypothetical protein